MAIKINNDGTITQLGKAPALKEKTYHIYIVQDHTLTKFFITSEKYHLSRIRSKAKRERFVDPSIELAHSLQGTLPEAKKIKKDMEELFSATEEAVNQCLNLNIKHTKRT